jgi:hypothetical protein
MRHLGSLLLGLAILTLNACTRSDAPSPSGGGDSGPGPEPGESAGGDPKPIALTDARLDQYLAYRREYSKNYAAWVKDYVGLAKSVDSKSNDFSKGLTGVAGLQRLGEKQEKELKALRARYGFNESEDDRLMAAITEVLAAKVADNPAMGDSLRSFREMQLKGGEEKKVADEMLKNLEDQERQALAEARKNHGAECVDLLSRRSRDLHQFQLEFWKTMTGQQDSPAK